MLGISNWGSVLVAMLCAELLVMAAVLYFLAWDRQQTTGLPLWEAFKDVFRKKDI